MLPLDANAARVSTFLLTSSMDSCHFGMIGQANEWILVTMNAGRSVPFPKGVPITVFGRLSIHPDMRRGTLAALYTLSADAITVH